MAAGRDGLRVRREEGVAGLPDLRCRSASIFLRMACVKRASQFVQHMRVHVCCCSPRPSWTDAFACPFRCRVQRCLLLRRAGCYGSYFDSWMMLLLLLCLLLYCVRECETWERLERKRVALPAGVLLERSKRRVSEFEIHLATCEHA